MPTQGKIEPIANIRVALSQASKITSDVDSGAEVGLLSLGMDIRYLSKVAMAHGTLFLGVRFGLGVLLVHSLSYDPFI